MHDSGFLSEFAFVDEKFEAEKFDFPVGKSVSVPSQRFSDPEGFASGFSCEKVVGFKDAPVFCSGFEMVAAERKIPEKLPGRVPQQRAECDILLVAQRVDDNSGGFKTDSERVIRQRQRCFQKQIRRCLFLIDVSAEDALPDLQIVGNGENPVFPIQLHPVAGLRSDFPLLRSGQEKFSGSGGEYGEDSGKKHCPGRKAGTHSATSFSAMTPEQ